MKLYINNSKTRAFAGWESQDEQRINGYVYAWVAGVEEETQVLNIMKNAVNRHKNEGYPNFHSFPKTAFLLEYTPASKQQEEFEQKKQQIKLDNLYEKV